MAMQLPQSQPVPTLLDFGVCDGYPIRGRLVAAYGRPTEFELRHTDGFGKSCSLRIPLGTRWGWRVTSTVGLTIEPMMACRECGFAGHLIDGRWVPVAND